MQRTRKHQHEVRFSVSSSPAAHAAALEVLLWAELSFPLDRAVIYLTLPFGFPYDTVIASCGIFLGSDFDCILYVAFGFGLWQKKPQPKLIDVISTQRLHIQILPLQIAASVQEAPQRDAGAGFRDPTAILPIAPDPGLGVPCLCQNIERGPVKGRYTSLCLLPPLVSLG